MNEDINSLVTTYQKDGSSDTLEKIKDIVKGITIEITKSYEGFINENEIALVVEESIIKAAKNYDQKRGASFTTYYYRVLKNGLINLDESYKKRRIVSSLDEYKEKEKELGNLTDESIIKSNTDILDPLIARENIELTSNEKKYMALQLRLEAEVTNELAAKVLGVNVKTVYNIKKSLQEKLANYKAQIKKDYETDPYLEKLDDAQRAMWRKSMAKEHYFNNDDNKS